MPDEKPLNHNNIQVMICSGPECKSRGAMEIRKMLRKFHKKMGRGLAISIHHCFSRCETDANLCPSVKINDEWIIHADANSVKKTLDALINTSLNS